MFNYNREVGYQLITNLLYVLDKLKSEPSYHALVLNEILSKQFSLKIKLCNPIVKNME